jgi:predicted Na+-dependent transporter
VTAEAQAAAQGRRILLSALTLAIAVLAGLGAGAVLGLEGGARSLALPALAFQTFLTVGGIPRARDREAVRDGALLVVLHYTVATLPMAVVAVAVGLDEPLGFGLFLIAIAPPGALIPAFAARLEVDVRSVLVFCLLAYAVSLVVTPVVLFLVAGTTLGVSSIAVTVGVGLIGPSVLGRLLHDRIDRVSPVLRRRVVNTMVFLICLGLGGEMVDGIRAAGVGLGGIALVLLALTLRTFGSGWLTSLLAPRRLATEASLAGGFKNVALAAAVGGVLLGPVAALPGLLAFFVDTAYFVWLARKASARARRAVP